jgi:hypothetical protein
MYIHTHTHTHTHTHPRTSTHTCTYFQVLDYIYIYIYIYMCIYIHTYIHTHACTYFQMLDRQRGGACKRGGLFAAQLDQERAHGSSRAIRGVCAPEGVPQLKVPINGFRAWHYAFVTWCVCVCVHFSAKEGVVWGCI